MADGLATWAMRRGPRRRGSPGRRSTRHPRVGVVQRREGVCRCSTPHRMATPRRRRYSTALSAMALGGLLVGCGTTAAPTPAPTPTPAGVVVALGTRVDTTKGSVLVDAFEAAVAGVTATPYPGDNFTAVEVEACGGPHADASTGVTTARFHLQIGRFSVRPVAPQRQPALRDTPLRPGQCVRGWLTFELPQGARPAYVVFQGSEVIGWRLP